MKMHNLSRNEKLRLFLALGFIVLVGLLAAACIATTDVSAQNERPQEENPAFIVAHDGAEITLIGTLGSYDRFNDNNDELYQVFRLQDKGNTCYVVTDVYYAGTGGSNAEASLQCSFAESQPQDQTHD
jgi:hypothetical protein